MITITCCKCGKTFERDERHEVGANARGARRRFCSRDCSKIYWNEIQTQKRKRPIEARKCGSCDVVFTPIHVRTQRFCSKKCADHDRWSAIPKPAESYAVKQCWKCKKDFIPTGQWTRRRFCSPVCRNRAYGRIWRERHPGWRSSRDRANKWGGNWWKVLERDNFTCQLCGFAGSAAGIKGLVVHHVDGEGERRGKNHDAENLQVLCRACHGKVHHDVMLVRKSGQLYVRFGDKLMKIIEDTP